MFFSLETKSFAWFSRSLIKVSKNKTNFDFLTTFTSYNKIIKSLDIMQKCLYQLYVFWPCWSSNKGNIQIIIIRDVVPWLTSYWCTFQWRIKLSDDIWKCMEWTTISITLAFQYNFCFGIVLGDAGAVSQQKYVLCEHTCPGGHIMKNQGYSVLTIYTGKPEIQVGKSNGPYHFIYPGFQRIFFSYRHWWFAAKPRQRGAKCRGENNIFFSSAFFFLR